MISGNASELNTFDGSCATAFDDFRFPLYGRDIIVVTMVMTHCDDISGLGDGSIVNAPAYSVRVGDYSYTSPLGNQETGMS